MRKRNGLVLLELVISLVLAVALIRPAAKALSMEDTSGGGFRTYYQEKKNSIDVLVFGSSHAACSFNNDILWKEAGIASFTLSSGGQYLPETAYYIEEALKTQTPKVIFVETLFAKSPEYYEDKGVYEFADVAVNRSDLSIRWSPTYVRMILEQAGNYGIDDTLKWEMLFKLPATHSRYAELTKGDFVRTEQYIRGYRGDYSSEPTDLPQMTEERAPLTELCTDTLQKILDMCAAKGVTPIFFCAPYIAPAEEVAVQNSVGDFLRERGIEFIDFNRDYERYGINYEEDFRDDHNHLNNSGAAKLTRALMELLGDFSFTDHRGDPDYEAWDRNSRYLADRDAEHLFSTTEQFEDYIGLLRDYRDEYMILVSFRGNYDVWQEDSLRHALEPVGISAEDYLQGGTAVFSKGNLVYYSDGSPEYTFDSKIGNTQVTIQRFYPPGTDTGSGDLHHIACTERLYIDGTDYAFIDNGITFIVVDTDLDRVIDVSGLDVYTSRDIVRNH